MQHPVKRTEIFALLLASGVLGVAAQPPQKNQTPPVFGVGVTLVAVPVYVTDKSGKSVQGLTADDFELEDAGKKVPIVAFQAIDVDAPTTEETQAEAASRPLAVQAAAPRQFMLLLDARFSPRQGLYLGRKALTSYVRDSLAPGDLVAVATMETAGLRILTNFTSDHDYIAEVIAGTSMAGTPSADPLGFSSTGVSGVGSLITDPLGPGGIAAAGGGGGGKNAEAELAAQDALMARAAGDEYRNLVFSFLADLEKLVQVVAPLRGRKQIVWFSGGFSEGVWTAPEGRYLLKKMEDIYRDAGRADVVIHTIDLFGILQSVDLASQTGPNGNMDSSGPPDFYSNPAAVNAVLKRGTGRATLIAMSQNTGGRAIQPRGDFGKAFGEVDQISRHSYVLAFETADPDAKDNRPRNLKVKVRRPGLSLSYRPSYTLSAAAPSAARAHTLATEAIAKGLTGGPLGLHLLTLPYRDAEGKPSVHAVLRIDGASLAEAAQGQALAVQVFGYAMAGGKVLDGLALNTSVDLTKIGTKVRDSGINLVTAFPVSTGAVDLRFFVRAGTADLTGSIQRTVAVPAFGPAERVLSAPLFLRAPSEEVVFPFQPKGRPPIPIPFHAGGNLFAPDAAAVLRPGEPREVCVFVWRDRAGSDAPFVVSGELLGPGQSSQPIRIEGEPSVVPDADGFDRYIVRVVGNPVAPGAYTLRLTFRDPTTGRTTRTEASVAVEM